MTSYASNGDGNWATTTIWTPNGTPGIDDDAQINHDVTIASAQSIDNIQINGGHLILNADLTMKDGGVFDIEDDLTSQISSNGATKALRKITSAGTWDFYIKNVTAEDTRDLDFDFIELENNNIYLGNPTHNIKFNTGSNLDPFITHASPIEQSEQLDIKLIDGRNDPRVFKKSRGPETVVIEGYAHKDVRLATLLKQMKQSDTRLAFAEHDVVLIPCYIERARVGKTSGAYNPFSITLTRCK